MRKSLFVGVLGTLLIVVSIFPFLKSDAAYAPNQKNVFTVGRQLPPGPLPNYDIRLVGKGEFTDQDLTSSAATQNAATQARGSAVAQFRSSLKSDEANNLRATINETGAMKNFFVDGGTLSVPQSDTADNIARGFLKQHAELFQSGAAVANLKMIGEDNDAGTTFLKYVQTIGDIKVFEGGVQVVVNKNGEVLNVREGFLVSGQPVKLKPALSEAQGIVRAFEYAGRTVEPSLVETYSRAAKGEMSQFANPVSIENEDVLSELNIVRIGDTARLAWHVFADAGKDAWYETLVDAQTGELLLRHNLYVEAAQGTVYTEDPGAGARTLVSFVGDTTINTRPLAGWALLQ